ncbi:MAG: dephospho-CoA kinase [Proteobacteria bacterium]|nr:dephospho-CoA kinase [Pseudomonadota bacterium]
MPVIAITGGIGAGKSTVRKIFEGLGARGIDADDLARQAVRPGSAGWSRIRETFGEEYFDEEGRLDRKRLARAVFSREGPRRLLESILHPLIMDAEARLIAEAVAERPERPVVVEIPLLAEGVAVDRYDGIVLVTASEKSRLERLERKGILTREEARARMRCQASDETRAQIADWTIDNDGPEEKTRKQVERIFHLLQVSEDRKNPGGWQGRA